MLIGVLARLEFQYLSILLFYCYFFFVISSLSSTDYLRLFLPTTGNHQRINSQKKLMIIIKRGLHKIPEEPGDQFVSPLIY